MKTTFKGLSLEIKLNKEVAKITVRDGNKYKSTYSAPLNDVNEKSKILEEAKSWLWNMGNFNGQANEMMNKNNTKWRKELNLTGNWEEV